MEFHGGDNCGGDNGGGSGESSGGGGKGFRVSSRSCSMAALRAPLEQRSSAAAAAAGATTLIPPPAAFSSSVPCRLAGALCGGEEKVKAFAWTPMAALPGVARMRRAVVAVSISAGDEMRIPGLSVVLCCCCFSPSSSSSSI